MTLPDPRVVASVGHLFRTVPACMIGDRADEVRRTDAALATIEHAFRVNGVELAEKFTAATADVSAAWDDVLDAASDFTSDRYVRAMARFTSLCGRDSSADRMAA